MAIVFHKKGEPAGMHELPMIGMCQSYWADDGWHNTETGELAPAPVDIKLTETSPEEYVGLPKPAPVSPEADAFDKLRQLCGYVEDGSSTVVSIYQDDATRSWCITIKFSPTVSKHYYAESLTDVIAQAWACNKPEY